jgi:hypothetical protein
MKKPLCIVAGAVFFASFGFASGQVPSRDFPDAANPTAAPPAALNPRSGTPARRDHAGGQRPRPCDHWPSSNHFRENAAKMDSVGGPKSEAGEEKK